MTAGNVGVPPTGVIVTLAALSVLCCQRLTPTHSRWYDVLGVSAIPMERKDKEDTAAALIFILFKMLCAHSFSKIDRTRVLTVLLAPMQISPLRGAKRLRRPCRDVGSASPLS